MKRIVYSLSLMIVSLICVYLNGVGLDSFTELYKEPVIVVEAIVAILIYIVLAVNEVTVVDNGYDKKYSFKNFILFVCLMLGGPLVTIYVALGGTIVSTFLLTIKHRKFDAPDIIYRFASPLLTASIMCSLFEICGGMKFPHVKFPLNFLIIISISFICYLSETVVTIMFGYVSGKSKKSFFKVLFQEYGWIYKYELWQAIYAILFFNAAAVLLYGNLEFKPIQTGSAEEISMKSTVLMGIPQDKYFIDIYEKYQFAKGPENFLSFISWQLGLLLIMYVPLNGWLSSFKTFISYNNQNISNAIQNMKEGIILLDGEGSIVNANQSAVEVFGGMADIAKGKNLGFSLKLIESRVNDGVNKLNELVTSFQSKEKSFATEIEFNINDEKNYLNVLVTPEVNRFNEVTGTVVTIENVTIYRRMIDEINEKNLKLEEYRIELEKRFKELQETQEQLIISEKMAVIGQLVSGIAHEINTPLASIKANLDVERMMLAMVDSSNPPTVDKFKGMVDTLSEVNNEAMERIVDLVKGLKNFARLDEADLKVVGVHEGIESTLMLVRNQMNAKIDIFKDFGDVPNVKCFPQQLNQVFLNVIINAIQSIKVEGTITIKTFFENDRVNIKIIDTGEGIKEENISKIFDPGFTTKGVGVGTGLGLAISYKIISKHKGEIFAQSKLNEGTTMTILLPVDLENMPEV